MDNTNNVLGMNLTFLSSKYKRITDQDKCQRLNIRAECTWLASQSVEEPADCFDDPRAQGPQRHHALFRNLSLETLIRIFPQVRRPVLCKNWRFPLCVFLSYHAKYWKMFNILLTLYLELIVTVVSLHTGKIVNYDVFLDFSC